MAGISDTSPEAERVLLATLRRMPIDYRWRQIGDMVHLAKILQAAGRRLRGEAGEAAPNDCLEVVKRVIDGFSGVGILYALCGSWASCLFGQLRLALDPGVIIEPLLGKEGSLCAWLGQDYHVDADAIQRRASFSIIHRRSAFQVNCFVRTDRPFEQSVMARRRSYALPGRAGPSLQCVAPEDIILLTLEGHPSGADLPEQQLKDVLGVLQVQAGRLDDAYLDHWAADLGVADLLGHARQESAV